MAIGDIRKEIKYICICICYDFIQTFLDAFEERIIIDSSNGGFLVGMVLENLLTVGLFYLLICSLVAVFRETENSVVILVLE